MIIQDTRVFLVLQNTRLKLVLKIFKDREWPRIFVFFSFLLLTLALAIGTFLFAKNTFAYIAYHPKFLQTTTFFILLSFFFLIFILTLGASFISSIGLLFVQDDDDLLLSMPIRPQTVFESRLVNLFFISSWPVVVFGLPLLLAFYRQTDFILLNFSLSFFALILILIISTLLASSVSILITYYVKGVLRRWLKIFGVIALPVAAWWVTYILIPPNFFEVFSKAEVYRLDEFLKTLPINSAYLPSTWATNYVFYSSTTSSVAYFNLLKLLILTLVLSLFSLRLINRKYYFALARARVGRFIAGPQDTTSSLFVKKHFPYLLKGVGGAFLEKDILMLSRNQAEILQGGFIVFIGLLYFLLLGKIPLAKIAQSLPGFSLGYFVQINFAVVSFILAILALRFVFPAISLEGQSAWLIWSAPFSKAKIYWQKLTTGWAFLSAVGVLATVFSTLILKFNFVLSFVQLSAFTATSLALTSINLGIGTILPNFEEKNPEKLSTSFGGILATFLSLAYILLVSLILFVGGTSPPLISAHLSVFILSLGVTSIFSIFSLAKIEKYEF